MTIPLEVFSLPIPRVHRSDATVPVTIYGRLWCTRTLLIRRALDQDKITYHYIDLDLHRDSRQRLHQVAGDAFATPIIRIESEWLKAPTIPEMHAALKRHGMRPEASSHPAQSGATRGGKSPHN
ncbi:MAG: glutaredoxin domain-containing protein [Terrimesophilobacter sp.]